MLNWEANLEVINTNGDHIELEPLDKLGCYVSCQQSSSPCLTSRLKKRTNYNLPKKIFDFTPKIGDHLHITLPAFFLIKVTLCLFGVPLLGMIFGSWIAASVSQNETIVMMVAIIGFCVGCMLARLFGSYLQKQVIYKLVCSRRMVWYKQCEN